MGGRRAISLSARETLPWIYQFTLTTFEPIIAILGAVQTFFVPASYLSTLTRDAVKLDPATTFLYTGYVGIWLYFAFIELVVLRLYDDLRLWKLLSLGMLLSDAFYAHSVAQAVGGWQAWASVGEWTTKDTIVLASTAPQVVIRVLMLLGIGERVPKKAAGKYGKAA